MGMAGQKLEMLFISHACRRKGIGFALMQYGMERYSLSWLTVNEQNPEANVFYESFGFHTYKRTELDEDLCRSTISHSLSKIPRVGIFYFACFSKNGRNHSGEWFDFRQKVLKTSIKSMHGQQAEK